MSHNRTKSWLLALGLHVLLVSTAAAQPEYPYAQGVGDVQIFDKADISTYGGGQPANQGWWGSYEFLHWSVSSPAKSLIGDPRLNVIGPTRTLIEWPHWLQENSLDTGWIDSNFTNGNRVEFGNWCGDRGWFASVITLHSSSQRLTASRVGINFFAPSQFGISLLEGFTDGTGAIVNSSALVTVAGATNEPDSFVVTGVGLAPNGFDDDYNQNGVFGDDGIDTTGDVIPDAQFPPDYGDLFLLPVYFDHVTIKNWSETAGVELNRAWRLNRSDHLGQWEVFAGARFFHFKERFDVQAVGGVLDETDWYTKGQNEIVGPQVGVRWSAQRNRIVLSSEARFAAGANFQSVQQNGVVGDKLDTFPIINNPLGPAGQPNSNKPLVMPATHFVNSFHATEFSPIGELRLNLEYQAFRDVYLTAGYTATYVAGLARPSTLIEYSLPRMGVDPNRNRDDLFLSGFNIGVTVNR